jgi:hypothetical protein
MLFLSWLSQDLRHAVRSLRRTPAVTLAAVATLALAIGANTAIFSLYQAVLLRRLPVESPEQLYFVAHGQAAPLSTSSHYPWFERVRRHAEVFAGAAAYNIRDFKVSSGEGVEIVVGQYASGNYHGFLAKVNPNAATEPQRNNPPLAPVKPAKPSLEALRSGVPAS